MVEAGQAAFSPRCLLVTNVGISVGLSGLGDALQQSNATRSLHALDASRLRHMAAAGLPVGVICHFWYHPVSLEQVREGRVVCPVRYQWLDAFLPGRGLRVIGAKVLWDQLLLSPFMWLTYFAFLHTLRDRLSFASLKVTSPA